MRLSLCILFLNRNMQSLRTCCNIRPFSITHILRRSLATDLVSRRPAEKIPSPTDKIKTPADFLKAIGRSSETKVDIGDWAEFWNASRLTMKDKGVGVQDRRYILWCMEKYRQGFKIKEFAHESKPKKKIRGWGPSMQNGKYVRGKGPSTQISQQGKSLSL